MDEEKSTAAEMKRLPRPQFFILRRVLLSVLVLLLAGGAGIYLYRENRYTYVELDTDPGFTLVNSGDIIASIREGLKEHSPAVRISFYAEGEYMENIADLVSELMARALADTGEADEGDWLLYQYGGYTCEYSHLQQDDGYRYTITIKPVYYMDYEQALETEEEIEAVLESFDLARDASDYEKFIAVYDYIYSNCSYDTVHQNNDYYKLKCTAYGTLIYGRAVCQGFCVTMYRLLKELGVDCRVVTGQALYEDGDPEFHSWLIVGLDGLYYNVDITWDIQNQSHTFLLKCDESFIRHERDEEFMTEEFLTAYPMAQADYPQNTYPLSAEETGTGS